ncbi:3-methylmercaptopropionyl-CoA dehydrogenase [bioreactor metagenome]|uniref:3-methylmercaptopropionyl-CoA dehydrogenase n=1 Tax=bioreactor metagenome TaxID=1076179 RepID=A0A645HGY6_9ZZZZ
MQIEKTEAELNANGSVDAKAVAARLAAARKAFLDVVDFMAGAAKTSPNDVYAGSVPYLMLTGNLVAGWQLARALLVAQELSAKGEDKQFMDAKIATARFYADHILVKTSALRDAVVDGAASVMALPQDAF